MRERDLSAVPLSAERCGGRAHVYVCVCVYVCVLQKRKVFRVKLEASRTIDA